MTRVATVHRSPGTRRLPAGWAQVGLFLGAYVLYTIGRTITHGELTIAQDNAVWIMALERDTGMAVEASVQRALDGTWVLWAMNPLYLAAQMVVVPAALIFVYRRSREIYRRLRDTVLATWLLSLPVYAAFPVAPPRLADSGLTDTVSEQTPIDMGSGFTTSFYNELAAVPSLHVGFALAVGLAVAATARHPLARAAAILWAPLVTLTVVATGNHYVFDAVAGIAATGVGYAFAVMPRRSRAPMHGGPPRLGTRVAGA